jgi:hypothetical protein
VSTSRRFTDIPSLGFHSIAPRPFTPLVFVEHLSRYAGFEKAP